MTRLEDIASKGNAKRKRGENRITCADGFNLSVIAGPYVYCSPRPGWGDGLPEDYPGPYSEVEVGYPSERPEPWDQWGKFCESPERPTDTVYGYVPVYLVHALIDSHGGEK